MEKTKGQGSGYPQQSRRLDNDVLNRCVGFSHICKDGLAAAPIFASGLRQKQLTSRALDKPNAQTFFKLEQYTTCSRNRELKGFGRFADAARVSDLNEKFDLTELIQVNVPQTSLVSVDIHKPAVLKTAAGRLLKQIQ
ncbi:hypothetical protein GCM10007856_01200 [Azospirillum oryzae]|nr:hypothetical protein GCM10007856_01200 [Azospirillum oryzae]